MRLAFVRVFNSGNRNKDIRQECGSAQHGTIYRYHTDNTIKVKYKADHLERFNKTITVHCNTEDSPLKLRITGNAK